MLALLLALSLAAAGEGDDPPVHDGGVCVGLSWVTLDPGETVTVEQRTDFTVYRFHGGKDAPDRAWGVYSGNYADVDSVGKVLLETQGIAVERVIEDGRFAGYLAQRGDDQNHFFGSVFTDDETDKRFFDRVDFGPKGQALCAKDQPAVAGDE